MTIPVSVTGNAGMETCFVNLVEPGHEVVVCINGVLGARMVDIVRGNAARPGFAPDAGVKVMDP